MQATLSESEKKTGFNLPLTPAATTIRSQFAKFYHTDEATLGYKSVIKLTNFIADEGCNW